MDMGGWITIALLGLVVIGQQVRGLRQDKKLADITRKQDEARGVLESMRWLEPEPQKEQEKKRPRLTEVPPLLWAGVVGAAGWLVVQTRAHARPLAASAGVAMVAALTSPLALSPSDDDREASPPPPVMVPQAPSSAPTTAPSSTPPKSRPSTVAPQPTQAPTPRSVPTPTTEAPTTEDQVADEVAPSPTTTVRAPRVQTPPPTTAPPPAATVPPQVPTTPPLGKPGCHWVVDVNATPIARVQLVCA